MPNFAKEKARKMSRANEEIYVSSSRNQSRLPRDPMKRRSIAHMDRHQPTFSSLYQLNQINDPRSSLYQRLHHHSYNMMTPAHSRQSMWHARSYESGIGKCKKKLNSLLIWHFNFLLIYRLGIHRITISHLWSAAFIKGNIFSRLCFIEFRRV